MEHLLSNSGGALRGKVFWRATLCAEAVILGWEWGKEFLWWGFLWAGRCAKRRIFAQRGV
jgi:hypothetical protein